MHFFESPEDVRWNADGDCVEFSVILRPYKGTVCVGRRVFQPLLERPTPERHVKTFHLQRTRFEMIAERSCVGRNWPGRDLREKTVGGRPSSLFGSASHLRGHDDQVVG